MKTPVTTSPAKRWLPIYTAPEARTPRHDVRTPTPERPLIVSVSSLRDFMRCRLKWHWRHNAQIVPKRKPAPLAMGTLGHLMMEQWYALPAKQRTVKAMDRLAFGLLGATDPDELSVEDAQLVKLMSVGYAKWTLDPFNPDGDVQHGIGDVAPETFFSLPLTKDRSIWVNGKIDLIFRPTVLKRAIAAKEFKFKSSLDVDDIELNLQLSGYLWALRQLYPKERAYQVHYTLLRKQAPGPRVKADLFRVAVVERTDAEIALWAEDAANAARDMIGAAIYPHPLKDCQWDCDYQQPCLNRADAAEVTHILRRDYAPKEHR